MPCELKIGGRMRTGLLVRFLGITASVAMLASAAVPLQAQGSLNDPDGLTGDYLLDARPVGLMFLSLTQVGPSVIGYAILVEPNAEDGVEGELATTQQAVEGTADGGAVVLTLGDWWTGQAVLTGRKDGADLVLTYPNDAGQVETAVFVPASPGEFNQALAEWNAGEQAGAELWAMLPTERDVPPGLIRMSERALSSDEVVSLYDYAGVTARRLSEWQWQSAVTREFVTQPALSSQASLTGVWVTIHRLGSQEAAGEALDAFSRSPINDAIAEVKVASVGDETRALTGPVYGEVPGVDWRQTKVYFRTAGHVVLVAGESPKVDPTPLVVELARRVLDPAYSKAQAETAAAIPRLSRELADRIAGLDDGAAWFGRQVEEVGRDLDGVQTAVEDMDEALGNLREAAAVRPMDCFQLGQVEFEYGQLEFESGQVEFHRGLFDASTGDLDAELSTVERMVQEVEDAADGLAAALDVSPYPPPALDALPREAVAAITAYEEAAGAAQTSLDALQADYTAALTAADDLMAEGNAVVEEIRPAAAC